MNQKDIFYCIIMLALLIRLSDKYKKNLHVDAVNVFETQPDIFPEISQFQWLYVD